MSPLKIVPSPDDPFSSRRVIYTPDPVDRPRASRPLGSIYFDADAGSYRVREKTRPSRSLFVGLDIGQAHDFTAIAIVERTSTGLSVSFLSRTRGRSYPSIVASVADLMSRPQLAGARLVIDSTGVGRPVLDMLKASGLAPIAVTITGGSRVTGGRSRLAVPKRDLVNAVLLALQAGTLAIAPNIDHADDLRQELVDMRARFSPAGNDRYGARDGAHDDLVLALALAVWAADRSRM